MSTEKSTTTPTKSEREATRLQAKKIADKKKDDKRKAAEGEKKARQTVAFRELAPVAKEINVRLEKAAQSDGKAFDHRLAAAIQLDAARQMCVERKINFKSWAEENVTQSFETVRKLVAIGASEDPQLAL